ncbi:bifunctional DNA primase/polymerase [Streptomyces sp. PAM3C]|uniref:bifunctional DNA primase/polymerase n=1 Tax=Streptomyces sp. PAM3C TaxID=2847300 RepID=UPI001C1DD6C2|nr:bifunctional DNA primase/polymerase [Streptomyces sp. PAM3C]MBU5944915.1 bifunctional DNA primase/polymerase [Streptomyces sp. PAM3C]
MSEKKNAPDLVTQAGAQNDQRAGGSVTTVAQPTDWQYALAQASEAARRGFHVFPLGRGKLPAIRSPHREDPPGTPPCKGECGRPGHGVHDATTDLDALAALFAQAPHATGYGVACGRGDMPLIGVDLDRKNGVDGVTELQQLAQRHGFRVPRTVTVCTPSGGFHLWFTGPAGTRVPNSAGKVAPGIDVRGTAGYLVGPGSVTPAGLYGLHPDLDEPTVFPIPEPLLRLILPPPPPRRLVAVPNGTAQLGRRMLGLVRTVLEAHPGERNGRLFWAACKAFEGAQFEDSGAVERALVEAAVAVGLDEREARATIASAQRTARREYA